jgi:hypothetical protein
MMPEPLAESFEREVLPLMRGVQAAAYRLILKRLFPIEWKSYAEAEGIIDTWQQDGDTAVATLDGGKSGEIRLKRFPGMTREPIVIKNLPYVAAPRHDGFVLMPSEVEAYRVGPNAFEFKGTNGFTHGGRQIQRSDARTSGVAQRQGWRQQPIVGLRGGGVSLEDKANSSYATG